MIIGIDINPATRPQRTGTENYTYELIEAMKKLPLELDERIVLYSMQPLREKLGVLPAQWESRVLKWPFKRFWTQLRFSLEMLRRPPDVLFVPAHAIPRLHPHSKKKQKWSVTTIHDLGFRRFKDAYEPSVRRYLHWSTKFAVGHAHTLLVPSEFTKHELMELYSVHEGRIVVTPLATDHSKFLGVTDTDVERVRQKYQLSSHYLLTVGRLEEKKNIVNLISGFEMFKSRRGVGDPFQLVLAGATGFGYEKIARFLEASSAKEFIRRLGFVDEHDLPALTKGAFAYVYPSWYEGFGLSALEAISAGTPLIASAIPAFEEVVGDVALFFPPNEPERLAEILRRLVDEPRRRDEFIALGSARAQTFSWEATAKKTLDVLRECDIPENILKI
ncbi:MAG: glycosyltransferase family 1 protein [Patescibacteria group bacterium]